MSTRYVYETTIRVEVVMADEGETSDYDGEPVEWGSPQEQEESAREWAEQAMPLDVTYGEDWVKVEAPPLSLVSKEDAGKEPPARG